MIDHALNKSISTSKVELSGVDKFYGTSQVLKKINLTLHRGEQCVLLGRSGSGKSSLLYLIGGLEKPSAGKITSFGYQLENQNDDQLAHYREKVVGFVFQFHFLLPTLTCRENILLPLHIFQKKAQDPTHQQYLKEMSVLLGIDHLLERYPYQISGGEQQRVSLLRALVTKPALLLCDEPTGNLDSQNSHLVMELVQNTAKKLGASLLVVTHDPKVAERFSRKITIEDGQLIG